MRRLYSPFAKILRWLAHPKYRPFKLIGLLLFSLLALYGIYRGVGTVQALGEPRNRAFLSWWQGDAETRAELITVQREACTNAPFILPAEGFIGLLYGDPRGPYSTSRPHQGIDIFSATGVGETAVYAAYDGYITQGRRLEKQPYPARSRRSLAARSANLALLHSHGRPRWQ